MSIVTRDQRPVKPRPRQRKPAAPVHGTCRWLILPIPCRDVESGILAIDQTEYVVTLGPDRSGARLTKPDGEIYHVDLARGQCDCPDATYRQERLDKGGCKHRKAVTAAVTVLPAKPVRQKMTACPSCQAPVDGVQLCPKCAAEEEEYAANHQAAEREAGGLDPWDCPEADDVYQLTDGSDLPMIDGPDEAA